MNGKANNFIMWIVGFMILALFGLVGVIHNGNVKADEVQAREIEKCKTAIALKADRKEIEEKLKTLGADVGAIKADLAELVGYLRGAETLD